MDIVVTGIVMAMLGYWAAHLRFTVERRKILRILTEAAAILTRLEDDRSRVDRGGVDHPYGR